MKKLERVNNELFETLTVEETQMVAGGADGTAEATWSETGGGDAKVDIKWSF